MTSRAIPSTPWVQLPLQAPAPGSVARDPVIRKIGPADLGAALSAGVEDFMAMPSHVVFLSLIYPVVGLLFAYVAAERSAVPLLFPLAAGFALVGPLAAIGLYELSRRREGGLEVSWKHAFSSLRTGSGRAIGMLGLLLLTIFSLWLLAAHGLYHAFNVGPLAPTTDFLDRLITTPAGRVFFLLGTSVGCIFAVAALVVSVVSFPMVLDRKVSAVTAIKTSMRAVAANPLAMALWGLIVAACLAAGSLPLFVGLAVVLPVLGHASWHLYRRVVAD